MVASNLLARFSLTRLVITAVPWVFLVLFAGLFWTFIAALVIAVVLLISRN